MVAERRRLVALPTLARRVSLPVAWLKAEAEAGHLPHLKVGRRLLFSVEAVEEALVELAGRQPEDAESRDERRRP